LEIQRVKTHEGGHGTDPKEEWIDNGKGVSLHWFKKGGVKKGESLVGTVGKGEEGVHG